MNAATSWHREYGKDGRLAWEMVRAGTVFAIVRFNRNSHQGYGPQWQYRLFVNGRTVGNFSRLGEAKFRAERDAY